MSERTLRDRVALVTGGSRGIGRAIGEELASRGAVVLVNHLESEDEALELVAEIRGRGGEASCIPGDVSEAAAVDSMIKGAVSEWGRIDILVNNAGYDRAAWFVDTGPEIWQRVIGVNFISVLLTTRAVLPGMILRRRGRIINIGSATAKLGFPTEAVYSGAKGAVAAFTRSLAREVGEYGVTVNVVAPGPTETPLTSQFNQEIEADPSFSRVFPEGPFESLRREIPLRRFGRPEDVAAAVAFIASDAASYITGQTLSVDGGYTM